MFRCFVETCHGASLQLKNLLKILLAMFAQGAFDVVGEEIALVDVAAHRTHPAAFAVLGFFGRGLRLGFDVLLVVVVGRGGLVGQHLGVEHIGDEHRVRAEIDALVDTAGQITVGVLGDVEHMVHGTVFSLAGGELVHLATRLEPEMLENEHWRFGGQHADVEHTGILDEVVRVVALVDRNGNLQGVARHLNHRVDNAAVVNVVIIGGQDV